MVGKMMIRIALSILCIMTFDFVRAGEPGALEIPGDAFELLMESAEDPCSLCSAKLKRKAFAILERKFYPGKEIVGDKKCCFVRTSECGKNEFVLSCYEKRESFENEEKEQRHYPRLTFIFHTKAYHYVGISEDDFSDDYFSKVYYNNSSHVRYEGRIKIITYKYGDKQTFNYYLKKNQIQIHCKVLELKKV